MDSAIILRAHGGGTCFSASYNINREELTGATSVTY